MPDLDEAIWRTIAYAALFRYPLRISELRRRLVDVSATAAEITACLRSSRLRARVAWRDGFVVPAGCEAWVDLRRQRSARSRRLVAAHARALRAIGSFPFVRMVALSGACAHENATDDDVDVFLITGRGRAWTVTLLLMIASKLAGLRRTLCLNYVLAEDGLALPERDAFTASELVALRPLAGGETYRRFVGANAWVADRHPNFFAGHERESEAVPRSVGAGLLERVADVFGAGLVERAARAVLEPYLRRRVRGPGVDLSPRRLKLHGHDHRGPVSRAFEAAQAPPEARSA